MNSKIQEHGYFNSHFLLNSGQFTLRDCLTEKIDNSEYSEATELHIRYTAWCYRLCKTGGTTETGKRTGA